MQGKPTESDDARHFVRERVLSAITAASLADSPTANEDYQFEKISKAWEHLTLALIVLGAPSGDLKDAVDRAMQTPVARRRR